MKKERKPDCDLGGCQWDSAGKRINTPSPDCSRCGWNRAENARRKAIPLTKNEDGLWRKVIESGKGN